MLRSTMRAFLVGGLALADPFTAPRDESLAPEILKPLEKIAKELAKGGRVIELDETLALLREAGLAEAAHTKLAASLRAEAVKVKKPAATLPSTANALKKCAADLAARLDVGEDDATHQSLARMVVRLDGDNVAAQTALGRSQVDGEWLDDTAKARRARAMKIGEALAKARLLDIKIETGKSNHNLFDGSPEISPSFARAHGATLHGVWAVEKLERVMREAMRALAVDRFLISGELAVPPLQSYECVAFDRNSGYLTALDRAHKLGMLDPKGLADGQLLSGIFAGNTNITWRVAEGALESSLHFDLAITANFGGAAALKLRDAQPGVVAGLINWSSLAYLGFRLPLLIVEETRESVTRIGSTASNTAEEQRLRERMLLLSEAGLAGGRAWMQYLAERREDPPFEASLVDQMGRLQGQELLKATYMLEMWLEDGPLIERLRKLPIGTTGAPRVPVVENACGRALTALEAEWRNWIAPPRHGLAERLAERLAGNAAESNGAPQPPGLEAAVNGVNALRKRAGLTKVAVDGDLETSRKCRKHALYLQQNPGQLDEWPDAHEEYADRPGFDPEGAFAGMHSVIAPGSKSAGQALDGWMGTFYHRLPLLNPGLVRIGFALEGEIAVLDTDSFVRDHEFLTTASHNPSRGDERFWGVAWPPDGASDVPTRFNLELPEPVPGQDHTNFGYPITYQLQCRFTDIPELSIELRSDSATGVIVPCHLSTPTAPTNPQLAPDRAWCLIPKKRLHPNATYVVVAALRVADIGLDDPFTWSFRTDR